MKCNYFLLRETTITALAVTSVELRVTLQTFPYTQYKIYEQLGICFDIIMNIILLSKRSRNRLNTKSIYETKKYLTKIILYDIIKNGIGIKNF